MNIALTNIQRGTPAYISPSAISSASFPDTQIAPPPSPAQLNYLLQGANVADFEKLEKNSKVVAQLAQTFSGKGEEAGITQTLGEINFGTVQVPTNPIQSGTFDALGTGAGIFNPSPQPDAAPGSVFQTLRPLLDQKLDYTKAEADFAANFYKTVSDDFQRRYGTQLPEDKDGFVRALETMMGAGLSPEDLEALVKSRLILQAEAEAGQRNSGVLGAAADRVRQIYVTVMGIAYGDGNAYLYNRPNDEMFSNALGQLIQNGTVDQEGARVITAAYAAYKSVDAAIQTLAGTPKAAGAAVDNLNLLLKNLLPAQQAAEITSSISKLKTAYVTVQNVVNGAQGQPNAYLKAATALFTDPNIFGGDFARTAGQIVAGYKLVQNVVNFANNEVNAGQKALDAVGALAATGVIDPNLAKTIQAVGATYKLTQNTINAFNGEVGAGVKALNAADLLGRLGVLGPEISNVINTGVKAYTAVDSVINLIRAPGIATGLGAVGAIAGLIGGQTASTIANIATLGFGIATGGIGAIIGGIVGLFGGLFGGGGRKFTTITDQLDATNNGAPDIIKYEAKGDDWYYEVDTAHLPLSHANFHISAESIFKYDDDGRMYVDKDSGDGTYRDYSYYRVGDTVYKNGWDGDYWEVGDSFKYTLSVDYHWHRINDAPSLEMRSYNTSIDLTADQYNQLLQGLGAQSGTLAPSDGRLGQLTQYISPNIGRLQIKQNKKQEGMTWYEDVNGDGVRDRITKYASLNGRTGADDSTYIELRNAQGETWLSYAVDANGNATASGFAANRLNASARIPTVQLLGLDPGNNLGSQVAAGTTLGMGQYLLSPNGLFAAVMQQDGNFVVWHGNTPVWASATENRGGNALAVQGDGNVVVYADGAALWSSRTHRAGPVNLVMQDDGNLVAYQQGTGRSVWATNTYDPAYTVPRAPGAVGWLDLGGTQIYGSVDWGKKPLSAEEQLAALQYIASSPDLIAAFGTDAAAGYRHMLSQGAVENRPVTFDPAAYMAANPDVAEAYGGSPLGAAQHYIQWGFAEGRALASFAQDTNGDGAPEQVRVFHDRVEITGVSLSGIQTVSRYSRDGAFLSAVGDFDNDGLRDETTLNADGSLTVRALEGDVLTTRILSADGALVELRGDFNGDGVEDVIRANPEGGWTASLNAPGGGVLASGTGAGLEDALRAAVYGTSDLRLSALQYIASNPDLIASIGTDWERGAEHMMTRAAVEGRESLFDAASYLELNPDLAQRFRGDLVAATEFYIQGGFRDTERVIRSLDMDVDGDGVADAILIRPQDVTIGLRNADGSIARVVQGDSLEDAVAQANIIGLLSWIAADDTRIATFGVDIVSAQRAVGQDVVVGDPNATFDLFEFVSREGARVQYFDGDLINVLASYILDRATALQSGVQASRAGAQAAANPLAPPPAAANATEDAFDWEDFRSLKALLTAQPEDTSVASANAASQAFWPAAGSLTSAQTIPSSAPAGPVAGEAVNPRGLILELLDAAKSAQSSDDSYLLIKQAIGLMQSV